MEAPLLRAQIAEPTQERNDFFVATRESAELRAETLQMGQALAKLLRELGAKFLLRTGVSDLCVGGAPLDDRAGRRGARLSLVLAREPGDGGGEGGAARADRRPEDSARTRVAPSGSRRNRITGRSLDQLAPGLAALSARHETQYSRLFRS